MLIRLAGEGDIENIVNLLAEEMYPEIEFGDLDIEKGAEGVREVFRDGLIWLVMDGEEIAATAGLYPSACFWWTSQRFAVDRWVFVRKQYRKSRAAFLLLNAIRATASKSDLPVLISISSPFDTEAKERLFRRYGEKRGNFYLIRPLES